MNRRKTIITAVVLILVLVVGGILAYVTDTDEKTNVFTIGKNVNIELYEDDWEEIGSTGKYRTKAATGTASGFDITPGSTIPKAPYVKNIGNNGSGSDAYIFLKVEIPYAPLTSGGASSELFELDDVDTTHWTLVSSSNGTRVYVYGSGTSEANLTKLQYNQETTKLFESVTLKSAYNPGVLPDSLEIKVSAYAIQAAELDYSSESGSSDAAKMFNLFD